MFNFSLKYFPTKCQSRQHVFSFPTCFFFPLFPFFPFYLFGATLWKSKRENVPNFVKYFLSTFQRVEHGRIKFPFRFILQSQRLPPPPRCSSRPPRGGPGSLFRAPFFRARRKPRHKAPPPRRTRPGRNRLAPVAVTGGRGSNLIIPTYLFVQILRYFHKFKKHWLTFLIFW